MSNVNDKVYEQYLQRLSARYRDNTKGKPVFETNIDHGLMWKRYLSSYNNQQYHNCCACHSFLNRYAGLVTIDDKGRTTSALWNTDDVDNEHDAVMTSRMLALAETAKVSGVFLSNEAVLGRETEGGWRHLCLHNPAVWKKTDPLFDTPRQAAARLHEAHGGLVRSLHEFNLPTIEKALEILRSGELFRSERVLPQAEWFADLFAKCGGAKPNVNMVWLAVATAPPGFAHVRSRMLGTLLADIKSGCSFHAIKHNFNEKMDIDNYQRSKSAPKAGQIDAAEKAVEALGIAPSFARRYTDRMDILVEGNVLWQTSEVRPRQPREVEKRTGVFAELRPEPVTPGTASVIVPPRRMTWDKFNRDILPHTAQLEYRVPLVGRFCSLTTAVDSKAPPILQWDMAEARNAVAWCFPNPPARAEEWNLEPGKTAKVLAIVNTPNMWNHDQPQRHHGEGVFLLLDGAKDTRNLPGGGLFVEHLRNDLKPYRSTIEAHMNKLTVQGADDPTTMAFGIGLLAGNDWTETAAMPTPGQDSTSKAPSEIHVMLVMDDSGSMAGYISPARTALRSLIDSVKAMPGKVDITVYKFGTRVTQLAYVPKLEMLGNIEGELNGRSGQTALFDAIGRAIEDASTFQKRKDVSYFLGIVTDGEENNSREYNAASIHRKISERLATGAWTIAFAGAGHNPRACAAEIGIPPGNVAVFSASARGFEDIGNRYAASTRDLAAAYRSGAKASTSFFASGTGTQSIGTDYPVLVATSFNGQTGAYMLDRYE